MIVCVYVLAGKICDSSSRSVSFGIDRSGKISKPLSRPDSISALIKSNSLSPCAVRSRPILRNNSGSLSNTRSVNTIREEMQGLLSRETSPTVGSDPFRHFPSGTYSVPFASPERYSSELDDLPSTSPPDEPAAESFTTSSTVRLINDTSVSPGALEEGTRSLMRTGAMDVGSSGYSSSPWSLELLSGQHPENHHLPLSPMSTSSVTVPPLNKVNSPTDCSSILSPIRWLKPSANRRNGRGVQSFFKSKRHNQELDMEDQHMD